MNKTSIEWVKNPDGTQGYTWNPITGCLNGCEYCYARKLANGRLKSTYQANSILPSHDEPDHKAHHSDPFYPRFWPGRLEVFKKRYSQLRACITFPKALGIFTCDMSDLFGIGIPEEWTRLVLEVIRINAFDRFYLLTKQPQNLIKFSPFPENCWVGVTATGLQMFNKAMFHLQKVDAKIKYISFEPLLEELKMDSSWLTLFGQPIINWVIIGAQTKPYKPPKVAWVQEIIDACDKAGIPVFLKDNLLVEHDKALTQGLWGLEKRQELPK